MTAEVRIIEGIKFLLQGVSFNELSLEKSETARPLVGNGAARWLPYALAGVRFYTRMKTVTARWPEGMTDDSSFVIPTMR